MFEVVAFKIYEIDIIFAKLVLLFLLFPQFVYRVVIFLKFFSAGKTELDIYGKQRAENVVYIRKDYVTLVEVVYAVIGGYGRKDYAAYHNDHNDRYKLKIFLLVVAVFWYVNENAAKVIRTCLSKLDDCGRFLDSSDKAEYGLLGRREIFGDDIFLCENGVQISPSYLSRLPMAAVGATPKNSQMFCGFIFSNRKHSKIPSHLSGVFDFMKICAQNANK